MKVIIAGSRTVTQNQFLLKAIEEAKFEITEVVCGRARGADTLGENWAISKGIPVKFFPADWDKHGRAAGPIRNAQMADYSDGAIVIWDGRSKGSLNMIEQMRKRNKPVYTFIVFLESPDAFGST